MVNSTASQTHLYHIYLDPCANCKKNYDFFADAYADMELRSGSVELILTRNMLGF